MYAHKQTFLTKIDVHTDVHVQMTIIRVSQILLNISCEQISLGEITKECDLKKCNVLQICPQYNRTGRYEVKSEVRYTSLNHIPF